jgi:hypothetical protein
MYFVCVYVSHAWSGRAMVFITLQNQSAPSQMTIYGARIKVNTLVSEGAIDAAG